MNVSILYFLPHIARYRYGIRKRDYKHNQFYFLIIQVKFSRLKIFLHLLARNTPIRPMRRFFRNCASPKRQKNGKDVVLVLSHPVSGEKLVGTMSGSG